MAAQPSRIGFPPRDGEVRSVIRQDLAAARGAHHPAVRLRPVEPCPIEFAINADGVELVNPDPPADHDEQERQVSELGDEPQRGARMLLISQCARDVRVVRAGPIVGRDQVRAQPQHDAGNGIEQQLDERDRHGRRERKGTVALSPIADQADRDDDSDAQQHELQQVVRPRVFERHGKHWAEEDEGQHDRDDQRANCRVRCEPQHDSGARLQDARSSRWR